MSVVVGCLSCAKLAQVESLGSRCACGGERALLLTVEQNRERWRRGVSLVDWFAAPRAPATRGECERTVRGACPYLRCQYNLGDVGQRLCELDVAEDGPQPFARIAALLGVTAPAVHRTFTVTVQRERARGATLPTVPEDDEHA